MSKTLNSGFLAKPDLGALKTAPSEYLWLQNWRGRGQLGSKRRGIEFKASLSSGVMGIFDAFIDGDPTSLDRFIVWTNDGSIYIFYPTELIITFTYLFSNGALTLQSPDLNWWSVTADLTTGGLTATGVAAPTTLISADLVISQGSTLGLLDSTGVWRVYTTLGVETTQRYAIAGANQTYSTARGYKTGYGVVFQEPNLSQWRLTVGNNGLTQTVQIL